MLAINGFNKNIQTIVALSGSRGLLQAGTLSFSEIKTAYINYLRSIQPTIPSVHGNGIRWPEFVKGSEEIAYLCGLFSEETTLTDVRYRIEQESDINSRLHSVESQLFNTIEYLGSLDSKLETLFRLCINSVFYAKCPTAGGGTCSSAIGVLWMEPRERWTTSDYAEFCVHEMTHTLMFLDELRFRHYHSVQSLAAPSTYAVSAILGIPRPLDKVLHALVVATEVLFARDRLWGHEERFRLHPPTNKLVRGISTSLESLEQYQGLEQYLAPRGIELFNKCRDLFRESFHQSEGPSCFA